MGSGFKLWWSGKGDGDVGVVVKDDICEVIKLRRVGD